MRFSFLHRRRRKAFTIVELLVVLGIIALMASLAFPNFSYMIRKAQSVKCSEHLHGIGIAVLQAVTDNNGYFPEIDQAAAPVYTPAGSVPGLVGALSRYGVSTNDIQCPIDMAAGAASSFQQYGSSYEWNPVFDDGADPVTAIAVGPIQIDVNSARIRLCTDFVAIHNGRVNALYGDGHVRAR